MHSRIIVHLTGVIVLLAGSAAKGVPLSPFPGFPSPIAPPPAGVPHSWSGSADSIHFLYRPGTGAVDPATCAGGDCLIRDGDVLISVFTLADPMGFSLAPGQEITGLYAAQIMKYPHSVSWGLTPYSGGLNAILGLAGAPPVATGDAGEGAAVALFANRGSFDDTGGPFTGTDRDLSLRSGTNCASLSDCLAEAVQGDLLEVAGFYGPDGVQGTADDLSQYFLSAWVPGSGGFFADLVDIRNAWGTNSDVWLSGLTLSSLAPQFDIRGLGEKGSSFSLWLAVYGGSGLKNGAFSRGTGSIWETRYQAPASVFEPSTLLLFGAGLFVLGVYSGRQGKKSVRPSQP